MRTKTANLMINVVDNGVHGFIILTVGWRFINILWRRCTWVSIVTVVFFRLIITPLIDGIQLGPNVELVYCLINGFLRYILLLSLLFYNTLRLNGNIEMKASLCAFLKFYGEWISVKTVWVLHIASLVIHESWRIYQFSPFVFWGFCAWVTYVIALII